VLEQALDDVALGHVDPYPAGATGPNPGSGAFGASASVSSVNLT
jgi:hypothetical protein